jgi:hypothetical protein
VIIPICFIVSVLVVAVAVEGRLCGLAALKVAVLLASAGLAASSSLRIRDLRVAVPGREHGDTFAGLEVDKRSFVRDVVPSLGLLAVAGDFVVLYTGERAEVKDFLGIKEQ